MTKKDKLIEAMTEQYGHTIDEWLGKSDYLVLHRALLGGMSKEWQRKLVALLQEFKDTFDWAKVAGNFQVSARDLKTNKFIKDDLRNCSDLSKLPYKNGVNEAKNSQAL